MTTANEIPMEFLQPCLTSLISHRKDKKILNISYTEKRLGAFNCMEDKRFQL